MGQTARGRKTAVAETVSGRPEVFRQDGRYGVMRGGRVTCPARFRRVERLPEDCGFFALAVYAVRGGQSEVTTVIGTDGRDLQVRLYGTVRWQDGCFRGGTDGEGGCWDPVGNAYYDGDPCFTRVVGVEVGLAREHGRGDAPCMRLRRSRGRVSPRFHLWEMFYNRDIIIARDYLIVKGDGNHAYRIRGFLGDGMVVEGDDGMSDYLKIMTDGRKAEAYERLPKECTKIADYRKLGLQRVQTK